MILLNAYCSWCILKNVFNCLLLKEDIVLVLISVFEFSPEISVFKSVEFENWFLVYYCYSLVSVCDIDTSNRCNHGDPISSF